MATKSRSYMRVVRHNRIRKHLRGTAERPRLAVFRSNAHISAQAIDDDSGKTLAAATSQQKALSGRVNKETAKKVGAAIADALKKQGIESVVFDRGGYRYHGCISSLAEGAREGGLKF